MKYRLHKKKEFEDSKKNIVQFGSSTGEYISQIPGLRKRIGYDYCAKAIEHFKQPNMEGRLIDLDSIDSEGQLTYEPVIKMDLEFPADIVCIRIMEFLAPESMTLLLFALITHAQPSSVFYLEMADVLDEKKAEQLKGINHLRTLPPGFIATFFAPRTDFKTISRTVNHKIEAETDMLVEQLIVQKL